MTRKDYIVIAGAFRRAASKARSDAEIKALTQLAFTIADVLKRDNPRFDKGAFIDASFWPE